MSCSILFAIEEVGTFAYCLPLLQKWQAFPPQDVQWNIAASETVKSADIFAADLPLISPSEANTRCFDTLICSLSPAPQFTSSLIKTAGNTIGILDTWKKSWALRQYEGLKTLAVIDEAHKATIQTEIDDVCEIQVIGHPAWEAVKPLPLPQPATIAFIAQPIKKYYAQTLGYDEDSAWEMLIDTLSGSHKLSYIPHPEQDLRSLPQSAQDNLENNQALQTHEIIIGCFSSLLMDAYLGGRQTLSLQPNQIGEDRCTLSSSAAIPLVTSAEQLRDALKKPHISQERTNPFTGSLKNLENLIC